MRESTHFKHASVMALLNFPEWKIAQTHTHTILVWITALRQKVTWTNDTARTD